MGFNTSGIGKRTPKRRCVVKRGMKNSVYGVCMGLDKKDSVNEFVTLVCTLVKYLRQIIWHLELVVLHLPNNLT